MTPANDNRVSAAPGGMGRNAMFGLAASAVVLLALVLGLLTIDPPWTARLRALDRLRSGDLQALLDSVRQSHRDTGKLPESLDKLTTYVGNARKADPVTGAPYEYAVAGERAFKLCAIFDLASRDQPVGYGPFVGHGAGHQCFDLTVADK
jgi:hypothetical protein